MAQMMRKLFETTGMQPTQAMLEAVRRMEAGEDPDRIDEEMGEQLDAEEPMYGEPHGGMKGRLRRFIEPPNVDPNLYDLLNTSNHDTPRPSPPRLGTSASEVAISKKCRKNRGLSFC